jgi:uncharacterized surface protein with fasciclin (FAS1) repeats
MKTLRSTLTATLAGGLLVLGAPLALAGSCGSGDHEHADAAQASKKGTIVDIAAANEDFSTLVAAVKAAGLVETLQGDGPFTVFAPTNEAFAALPEGTVETLLKPENKDQLIAILTYHVVPGQVLAKDVVKLKEAKTVQGEAVKIKVKKDTVMINGAKVLMTDIVADNGVIHVIDSVILPPKGDESAE